MKKLALVLGSLLVVGTAASAKEVMPAPVVVPERIVEIVEKPVIVYRDREVAPKWRPSGSVDVHTRFKGEVEGHKLRDNDEFGWKGNDYNVELRTKASVNFTENQNLTVEFRDKYGLKHTNNKADSHSRTELKHTYKFGKLGSSMVDARLETRFRFDGDKNVEFKPVFDFSEYFFKNDYVKATALELAPVFRHSFSRGENYGNIYALYANAEFELPYGVTFQAEFDQLYKYSKVNRTEANDKDDRTAKTGAVELTLGKNFGLYNEGKHKVDFRLEGVYGTGWSYSKSDEASVAAAGTVREGKDKNERWGSYTAKFEPSLSYNFKATEFVNLYARLGAEYVNRTERRPDAKHWRWQPTARLGFKATF